MNYPRDQAIIPHLKCEKITPMQGNVAMTNDLIERVARIIANAMGDNYSDAFKNKERWIAKRGMSGGRFREVNEPMQCDYLAAAQSAIASMQADADLDRIKRERDQAVEALREAERAIAEYYRYWTGGETRGSYDGKPERNGLWRAQHEARQALASIEGTGHE